VMDMIGVSRRDLPRSAWPRSIREIRERVAMAFCDMDDPCNGVVP
jgi:hypothetical protein